MRSIQLRFLMLALGAALCAACGDRAPADSSADQAATSKPASPQSAAAALAAADSASVEDAEKLTADMVRGVSPGKPTAPVELKFNVAAKPALGAVLSIDVAVLATAPSDSMTLSVQGSTGLEVDPSTSLANFPKSQAGALHRHKLLVTPRAEGAFYLNVLITTVVPGAGPQSRSFSIPLLVGGVAALEKPLAALPAIDSSDQRVN